MLDKKISNILNKLKSVKDIKDMSVYFLDDGSIGYQIDNDKNDYVYIDNSILKDSLKKHLNDYFNKKLPNIGLLNQIIKKYGEKFKNYLKGDFDKKDKIENIINTKKTYFDLKDFYKENKITIDTEKLMKDLINDIYSSKDKIILDYIYRPDSIQNIKSGIILKYAN